MSEDHPGNHDRITRRDAMKTIGTGLAAAPALVAASCATHPAARTARSGSGRPPNVLYIMTDQQRCDSLGCNGNEKALTPNLDRLASQGVRFTSAYSTQPVCSPCRSSMVGGQFPHATTVYENNRRFPDDHWAYPRAMQQAGYRTCYIGKWHLGVKPLHDFWDVWHGFETGLPHWIDKQQGLYRPDQEADRAIEFIAANTDRPFLCWLSFYPPHPPNQVPQEDLTLFQGRIEAPEYPDYYAMVHRIDTNVGRVLAELERQGLREDTLVVFTSDHGHNFVTRWNNHHKRLCYDSAANVPLIWSRPGTLPEGTSCTRLWSMADLAPTILDLCGLPVPEGLHGQSARRLLSGDATGWHEDILIENRPYRWDHPTLSEMEDRCVVTDRYKLILNTSRPPELYDRQEQPADTTNLYGRPESADVVADLSRRLRRWGERTDDALCGRLVDQWLV